MKNFLKNYRMSLVLLSSILIGGIIGIILGTKAAVLNSTGNTACAMLVSRFVDGKKWLP